MLKGTLKIDNKDLKYKLRVIEYVNTVGLGVICIEYKCDSLFYKDIYCGNQCLETIYSTLDRFTKDEMERFIASHIKDDLECRNRKNKYS